MEIKERIECATKEFNENGRSDKFVALEDEVMQNQNPAEIYYFARYAKGASVKRVQKALIKTGMLKVSYYFQQNVKGSDVEMFVKLAIKKNNKFWISKFIELAKSSGKYSKIEYLVKDLGVEAPKPFDTNAIIRYANGEYKRNGRSVKFRQLERYMMHNEIPGNVITFMQRVEGIDLRKFEDVAILRGDPLLMFLIAISVKDSDKEFMKEGLRLAKLDYRMIEKGWKDIANEKARLESELASATNSKSIESLEMALLHIPTKPAYIAKIDNDFIAKI